ncbi:MAG TPA: ABC transporter ATP-binding protein, partial [Mycobacteriales bacterium]|nr:ABC transporter ATP-binding protein [Mycobacteriales bacterium]
MERSAAGGRADPTASASEDRLTGTGLDGVTVTYGTTVALRDLTLRAADGELLVVLGSSGSGKSTLLRAVAGLIPLQSGEIVIAGRQVTGLSPQDRHVAMIFESTALVPFLDVAHNMAWGLRARHVPEAEVEQRVSARARDLRLSRLLGRKPKALSTGERGLVGIGRALVQAPDVFLLDEPLTHLDAAQRLSVRRQIVEVVRSLGVTTLYVTHDQAEALAIADRVAVLHEGSVVQVGKPLDLYERPATLFVAGFVGSPPIGLLPARLVASAGTAGFQVAARTFPLWAPVPAELSDFVGQEVVLGLRAEDVHDVAQGYEPDLATLVATVARVEYTGGQNTVTVSVNAPAVTAPG